MLILLSLALADDVQVGGAIDLAGGSDFTGDSGVGLGLRQVEGDLRVEGENVGVELQLDTAAVLTGDGLFIYSLGPERLVGEGFGKGWRLAGGVYQAPFRMESVDPWRNALVTPSLVSRRVPGAMLGGELTLGGPVASVVLVAGGQPYTTNVFDLDQAGPMPFLAGARGEFDVEVVELGLGAWAGGINGAPFGGLEAGARLDLLIVGAEAEIVTDLRDDHALSLQGEIWPDGLFSPVTRVEFASEGFGVAVGASSTIADIVKLKAEASYQAGNAGVYLEAAVFSKWPGDDTPRAGDTSTKRRSTD